ncbi:MAG: HAMP domain-containing protein [Peptococcaceae bacterium]|jgi:two-component system sensor histidine kinase BaeS|nr:HAMP domain-containing protein [Peptococcaceae bacterium]
MSFRRKIIVALVGLVLFLAFVLTGLSSVFMRAYLGRTLESMQQNSISLWADNLAVYYVEHQGWEGLADYIGDVVRVNENDDRRMQFRNGRYVYVFNVDETVVCAPDSVDTHKQAGDLPAYETIVRQWQPILVNGQLVGHFWINPAVFTGQNRFAREIGEIITRAILLGLVLTCLLASLIGVLLARRVTLPLKTLMEGVGKVTNGDLSVHIDIRGEDELAMLGNAFNRMTEKLERNEEVRRTMVADIAHELRTPLSVIVGKLESIQEGVLQATPENLLPIQDETIRLIRLVRDLQQLSLAEAGKLSLDIQTLDIRKLLERILEQFEFELEERQINSVIESARDIREIAADSDRLTQVFVNLIGNALTHTPDGGKLTFRLANVTSAQNGADTGAWVQVEVMDNGRGIPQEDLEYIFNRFYRIEKDRGRKTGGTGIGLAIAKEFVQAHGGSITARSEWGQGARFIILLPVKANGASPARVEAPINS